MRPPRYLWDTQEDSLKKYSQLNLVGKSLLKQLPLPKEVRPRRGSTSRSLYREQ